MSDENIDHLRSQYEKFLRFSGFTDHDFILSGNKYKNRKIQYFFEKFLKDSCN